LVGCALDDIHDSSASMSAGSNVEEDHFISALLVVAHRQLDRIAHIAQFTGFGFAELHTSRDLAAMNIETGNDAPG